VGEIDGGVSRDFVVLFSSIKSNIIQFNIVHGIKARFRSIQGPVGYYGPTTLPLHHTDLNGDTYIFKCD